ncbi:MAG: hypothetical protein ABSH21_12175 [Verrucomicrobiia bacterium]|jgi:hypothetical protein
MKMPLPHTFPRREPGVALVLTLGILALVMLLLIAFVTSMRVENTASRNFNDGIRARQLAQGAVDEAVALLKFNTANAPNYYVTQPGRAASTAASSYPQETLLRSYDSGPTPTYAYLNSDGSIIPLNLDYQTPSVATIVAHWVPVIYTNPATPGTGTIVGRYAYWVDDEAAKVNINSANQRVNALGPTPSDIDLRALIGPLNPGDISTYQLSHGGPFMTPAEWNLVQTAFVSALYSNNSFYVTTYSADTNLTPWGAAKLNLNTLGTGTNGVAAVTNVLGNIGLTNWFPSSTFASSTFANKYGANLLNQIAANIIDYGTLVDDATTDSQSSPTYCGLKPVPYINEVVGYAAIDQPNSNAFFGVSFELINPYLKAKGSGYTLNGTWTVLATGLTPTTPLPVNVPFGPIPISQNVPAQGYYMTPTNWLYQTINDPQVGSLAPGAIVPVTVIFSNLRLYNSSGNLVDFAYGLTNPPVPPINILASGATNVFAIGDSDPRSHRSMSMVNPLTGTTVPLWGNEAPGSHSFYSSHPLTATPSDLTDDGTEPSASQVIDSNYHITESPYQSVGELGYIHTGIPWRSLRLQPKGTVGPPNHIPDWVVLDLFTITDSALTGRININAQMIIQPGGVGTLNIRKRPLTALIGQSGSPLAGTLADQNIYNQLWVTTYAPPGVAPWAPTFANVYAMAGQICEIQGVSDSTVGSTDAQREDGVRSIIDMVTIRSNTFTVWAVGQALKATPTGVIVTGEAKVQAVVQRDFTGQFRILYFRYY